MEKGKEEDEKKEGVHVMRLGFEVANVNKPLASVKRIVEKGNRVIFGPGKKGNYTENERTQNRMYLRPNGRGPFLMAVKFLNGEKTFITVDSGAEESVCPWDWGERFGIDTEGKKYSFRSASGDWIEHWGHRDVLVTSFF